MIVVCWCFDGDLLVVLLCKKSYKPHKYVVSCWWFVGGCRVTIHYNRRNTMKKICKFLTVFLLAITLGFLANSESVDAKSKVKISNSKITLTVGQSKTLKVKGTKKKPKWSSSKKSVATVSSKGKVVAKKAGNTTITAKIGKKKYKCKVTVKNKKKQQNTNVAKPTTPANPTPTVPANPVGSRTNPDNPRNGVTVKDYSRTYYFKLNDVYKGNDAINVLKSYGKWGENEQDELYNHPNTTLVLFSFDMSAISGYDNYYLDGIDILNPYSFYNSSATQNLGEIPALYLDWEYDRSEIKLYNGGSSKMYAAFFIPSNITSFTYNNDDHWVRYDF